MPKFVFKKYEQMLRITNLYICQNQIINYALLTQE